MKWISSIYQRGPKEIKPGGPGKKVLYPGGVKKCTACKLEKNVDLFLLKGSYRASRCKECTHRLWKKKYYAEHTRQKSWSRWYPTIQRRVCVKCHVDKTVDFFYRISGTKYFRAACKECNGKDGKLTREKKKEKEKKRNETLSQLQNLFHQIAR